MDGREDSPLLEAAGSDSGVASIKSKRRKIFRLPRNQLGNSESSTNEIFSRRAGSSASSDSHAIARRHESQSSDALQNAETGEHSRSGTLVHLSCEHREEVSRVSCLFVAAFDPRRGNLIEWRFPDEFDLDGVEFKAIPSGAHAVSEDYVLFRHGAFFGAAAFASRASGKEDRGARSLSIGVLSTTYAHLSSHLRFLQAAAQAQLDTPRVFTDLVAYFERNRGGQTLPDVSASVEEPAVPADGVLGRSDSLLVLCNAQLPSRQVFLKQMTAHEPQAGFCEFLKLYGARVFALWRLTMLRKRVLFYSAPPVGPTCYHVYWSAALADHALPPSRRRGGPLSPFDRYASANLLFLTSLADCSDLEGQSGTGWLACTSDRLFESKSSLYDALVSLPRGKTSSETLRVSEPQLRFAIAVGRADRARLRKLTQVVAAAQPHARDAALRTYFRHLNTELLTALRCVAARPNPDDRLLTAANLRALQLDLSDSIDRHFLAELIDSLELELTVAVEPPSFFHSIFCPCCPGSSDGLD